MWVQCHKRTFAKGQIVEEGGDSGVNGPDARPLVALEYKPELDHVMEEHPDQDFASDPQKIESKRF